MIYNYYPNNDEINSLLQEAIIVFDTNALLELYYYTDATRNNIIDNVFPHLKDRLWLPHQVMFEFIKNREKVAHKPIQSYSRLLEKVSGDDESGDMQRIFEDVKSILTCKNNLNGRLKTLREKLSTQNRHPYCDAEIFSDIIETKSDFNESITALKVKLDGLHSSLIALKEEREEELKLEVDNDRIFDAIKECFTVGDEFEFKMLMQIVSEGSFRYAEKIPPGYADIKDKVGLQVYGDFILWKQLLKHASENKKSFIFVTNETKPDWLDKHNNNPRIELLKEFHSINNERIWLYSLSKFLHEINGIIESIDINEDVLREVEEQQIIAEELFFAKNRNEDERPKFRDIEESVLLDELQIASESLPFVGLRYFVVDILGNKGYKYESSYLLINQLIDKGKIIRDKVSNLDGTHDVTTIDIDLLEVRMDLHQNK